VHVTGLVPPACCLVFGISLVRMAPVAPVCKSLQPDMCCAAVSCRCLEAAVPGNTLGKVHQLSVQLLSEGLRDLGLLPRATLEDFQKGLYRWGIQQGTCAV
jgi:hypothetical protein